MFDGRGRNEGRQIGAGGRTRRILDRRFRLGFGGQMHAMASKDGARGSSRRISSRSSGMSRRSGSTAGARLTAAGAG